MQERKECETLSKVSGITRLAIQAYRKMARAKRRAQELEVELNNWLAQVPDEEVNFYVERTIAIDKQEDAKLKTFLRLFHKR